MSKQYYSLFLIPLISACTWGGAPSDFSGMYTSHVESQIESIREISDDLGIGKGYAIDGLMRLSAAVPGYMSGVLSADYSSRIDGKNIEFTAKNLLLGYEAFIASGSVSLDTLGITTHAGDAYFLMKGLKQNNMLSPSMVSVFQKYENIWLSLTRKDIQDSMSGSSSESDTQAYKISEGLSTLTLKDIQQYLVQYPLFQSTKDLGTVGSYHSYSVILNTTGIVSLVDALSERMTGSGLSADSRSALSKELSSYQNSGTISYDPKDPKYLALDLTLTPPQGDALHLNVLQSKEASTVLIATGKNELALRVDSSREGEKNISLTVKQENSEILKLISIVKYEGKDFRTMQLTLTSPVQGVTLTMNQRNTKDGNFDGDMNFGVGNLSWTGKISKQSLAGLHIQGAMIGTSVSMDLESDREDMLYGPFIIKSGGEESIHVDVGLRVTPERFSLSLDTVIPGTESDSGAIASPKAHFDADIIAKRSNFSGKIEVPTTTKPLKEFIDALDALAPTDSFTEESPTIDTGITEDSGKTVESPVSIQ